MNQKLRKETVAVHGGSRKDDAFGAINEPIYMTSNYRIPTDGTPVDWSGIHSNIYCRNRNVNQMVLQDKLCALTGAEDCAIFASGVAALAAVFTTMLNSGDHAIVSEVCYSATNLLFREYLPKKYGVEVTLLDTTDTEAVRAAIRPNTKLIHVETPGNPTTGISDLDAIAEIAHAAGAKLSVDATFAGPICVYPLKHGADLEVHSMTKYINGHGDSLGGCVMGKTKLIDQIKELAMVNYGGILSPFNAWLIMRGMMTLDMRVRKHCENALAVAQFLEVHPLVDLVNYPALPSHPQHALCQTQMHGMGGGIVSFWLKKNIGGMSPEEANKKLLDATRLMTIATSLGEGCTLIQIEHSGMIRIAVGLENKEDLLRDLTQAFDALTR